MNINNSKTFNTKYIGILSLENTTFSQVQLVVQDLVITHIAQNLIQKITGFLQANALLSFSGYKMKRILLQCFRKAASNHQLMVITYSIFMPSFQTKKSSQSPINQQFDPFRTP